jgi:thiol-disulfide isomerase/thioredoxin
MNPPEVSKPATGRLRRLAALRESLASIPGRRTGCFLLCLGLAVLPVASARTPGEIPVGGVLREATLQGLNGPSRKLSEYRGRPLVINVWASWCGPCVEEMASLERLAWTEDRIAFAVIGISTDDYPDRALAFLNRSNATLRHFIDQAQKMENMLGASTIPLTVLVDAKGHVLDKIYGARQWDSPESLQLISRTFRTPKATAVR